MERKFFKEINTLEELKKEYKTLVLKYHPDRPAGDLKMMQEINAEYDRVFMVVKDIHKNVKGETYTKETKEAPEEFKNIIEQLIKLDNIEIEIIGSFIWVSGETKPHKEKLRELKFMWHSKKSMWYKAPVGYKGWGTKKEYSIEEIRAMYGSRGKFRGRANEEEKQIKARC